jgi:hypothetical protein
MQSFEVPGMKNKLSLQSIQLLASGPVQVLQVAWQVVCSQTLAAFSIYPKIIYIKFPL